MKIGANQLITTLFSLHVQSKHPHELPPKEKALLDLLQKHAPDFVSKDELIEQLWNNSRDGGSEWTLTACQVPLLRDTLS